MAIFYQLSKCDLSPVQQINHLGFTLDLPRHVFLLTDKQYIKILEKVSTVLTVSRPRAKFIRKRFLAQIIGYLQFCCLALPEGRF